MMERSLLFQAIRYALMIAAAFGAVAYELWAIDDALLPREQWTWQPAGVACSTPEAKSVCRLSEGQPDGR